MPMVDVRKVRVLVDQRLVAVPMFMWIVTVPGEVVFVLVVFVMDVPMAMLCRKHPANPPSPSRLAH